MAVYNNMMVGIKKQGGKIPTYESGSRQKTYSGGSGVSARITDASGALSAGSNMLTTALNEQIKAGQGLGAVISGAGKEISDVAIKQEQLYTDTKATELALEYRKQVTEMLNNKDNTGLLQTQQEGAQGIAGKYKKNANEIMASLLDGMSEDVKSAFYGKVNEYNLSNLGTVQQHEGKEFKTWQVNIHTAAGKQYGDNAIQNAENPEAMAENCRLAGDEFLKVGQLSGLSGEALERYTLENVSKYVSGSVSKVAHNSPQRARVMLQGAQKYMTAKDILSASESIISRENTLAIQALHAENAARARAEAAEKHYLSQIKPQIDDAVYYAYATGKVDRGLAVVEDLRKNGQIEMAANLAVELQTANESRELISKVDEMDLPEAKQFVAGLRVMQEGGKDITGTPFEQAVDPKNPDVGPGKRYKKNETILTNMENALKKKETIIKNDGMTWALSTEKPIVKKEDGTLDTVATTTEAVNMQKRQGLLPTQIKVMNDSQAKQLADEINKSAVPFSIMKKVTAEYGEKNMPYVMQQIEDKVNSPIDMPLFMTLPEKLANELLQFRLDINNPKSDRKENTRATLKENLETTTSLAAAALGTGGDREMLQSFPGANRGSLIKNIGLLGLYYMTEGKDGVIIPNMQDAVKEARKTFLGNWEGTTVRGGNIRIPIKAEDGTKYNTDNIVFNLKTSIDNLFKDRNSDFYKQYVGENLPEAIRITRENGVRQRIGVMNNVTSDGYWFTFDGSPLGVNGKVLPVNSTFDDLSRDWTQEMLQGKGIGGE